MFGAVQITLVLTIFTGKFARFGVHYQTIVNSISQIMLIIIFLSFWIIALRPRKHSLAWTLLHGAQSKTNKPSLFKGLMLHAPEFHFIFAVLRKLATLLTEIPCL